MFYVRDIEVRFADRVLLDNVSFMITPRDRIGLIGRNGAGKSTLLKIMSGHQSPDNGSLEWPSSTTIGYLRQEFELNESQTVMDETMSCHDVAMTLQSDLDKLNIQLGERSDYESPSYAKLLEQLASISSQLEHFNISTLRIETQKILKGLGFTDRDFERKVSEFSGGWKMRIELAKLLLRKPDLLLLDEPTNHLDIESIIWLEDYLTTYSGTVIVISHDIQFLENVCNRIIEVENGQIYDYRLTYSRFLAEKEKQREIQQAAYENQQRDLAQKEKTINRFMAKATKTKMAQSMAKQLEKVDRIEAPTELGKAMSIKFAEIPRSGREAVKTVNISKSFGEKLVLNDVNITIERGDRVAFVGQNGQGKTTLAKIIVGILEASSGFIDSGANLHISYYAQNQSELLDLKSTVLDVMYDKAPEDMRTKVRSILGAFLFSGDDVDKKVSVLSGGERARLAMASLIMKPCNLLILDEPTNHLDIYSKDVLKQALKDYKGTLLVISHDREFLTGLTNKVVEFRDGHTYEYLGDIDYFLAKRKLVDMREVDLYKSDNKNNNPHLSNTPEKAKHSLSADEYRNINKQIQAVERDIEKLEKQIQNLENEMAQVEFYQRTDVADVHMNYRQLEENLMQKMKVWEELAEKL
jgi:ATP-binding cassette subfamily F protein 3